MKKKQLANRERITKEFLELTTIDAVSFGERNIADVLKGKLEKLGFQVEEDRAGEGYEGNAGNLYGFLKGGLDINPILLSAHMDTVQPGLGKKPVLHETGRITSDGSTVLGADDVTGLVEILEGIRIVQESGIPHRNVEILFSIGEEEYVKGSNLFDFSKVKSKDAYVLDMSGTVGSAAIKAPTILSFFIEVKGKAAHAGFHPEEGVNSIEIVSNAISKIKQGHIEFDTTLNIGTITGGTATNIVSESCVCTGEIRSYSHEKALREVEKLRKTFEEECAGARASLDFQTEINLKAYEVNRNRSVVKRFQAATKRLCLEGKLVETFGGSDNNNFVRNGIDGVVLSCGMYQVHSKNEYTTVDDMEKGAYLVAELILEP